MESFIGKTAIIIAAVVALVFGGTTAANAMGNLTPPSGYTLPLCNTVDGFTSHNCFNKVAKPDIDIVGVILYFPAYGSAASSAGKALANGATMPFCKYTTSDNCFWDGKGTSKSYTTINARIYYLDYTTPVPKITPNKTVVKPLTTGPVKK